MQCILYKICTNTYCSLSSSIFISVKNVHIHAYLFRNTHLHITSVSSNLLPNILAAPCIQMRPQLSPSNPGTMSSKEREWLEQRAGYSLEMEGGMEGWEPRWGEEGMRGWWEWCEDTSLTVSQRVRGCMPGKQGCVSTTPLDTSAQHHTAKAHSPNLKWINKKRALVAAGLSKAN